MDAGGDIEARIYDVTNATAYKYKTFYVNSDTDGIVYSGFFHLTFTSESRELAIQWKGVEGGGGPTRTYYISHADLEFWKIPT